VENADIYCETEQNVQRGTGTSELQYPSQANMSNILTSIFIFMNIRLREDEKSNQPEDGVLLRRNMSGKCRVKG
jgi:hypothetical protein